MRIEIVCIGSELLSDKVNTNSNAIADRLARLGFHADQVATVGDHMQDCVRAIKESLLRSDVVITCGGLGPTFDDLTRECAARALGRNLVYSGSIHKKIRARFRALGLNMPEENKIQAYLLRGAKEISNSFGTAPGQIINLKEKTLILLPGPAKECLPMMDRAALPYLKKKYPASITDRLTLHIFGHPESAIDELILPVVQKNWDGAHLKVTFGIIAHQSIVDVKAMVQGRDQPLIKKTLGRIKQELRQILGDRIYGENGKTLEAVAGKILESKGQTLALAESCTGGRLGNKITDVSGSTGYFLEGVIAYSNQSKMRLLGVKSKTLQKYGAVSAECAMEMARGIRKRSHADWGLSVTGIAGPGGGSASKPVGTVYFGMASPNLTEAVKKNFSGTRTEIKEKSALCALDLLRVRLLKR